MSSTVFILGAGASKQAGAPLMREFLDVAYNLWKTRQVVEPPFEAVFKALSSLQSVHSKSQLDLDNIEAVFSACDMAKTLQRFPASGVKGSSIDLDELIRHLKIVIMATLESTLRFPCSGGRRRSPEPYDQFVKLVEGLREAVKPEHTVSILTFNYDIAVDCALCDQEYVADYAVDETDPRGTNSIPLLKLHGSLNWTDTVDGKVIKPWHMQHYWKTTSFRGLNDAKSLCVRIGSQLGKHDFGEPTTGVPVLVPPTWNKSDSHRALTRVWSRAAKELSEAENVFVVGYSLPDTDYFFRYLYALGTQGDVLLKRFWVFDVDNTGTVERRFKSMLGPAALARFQYHRRDFASGIAHLRETFGVK